MARTKRPDGSAKLTLKDGTKLADACATLIKYFDTVIERGSVARAIEMVLKAAESGAFDDRKAATDQVAIVLRGRAVY
jgi:hypothetical protein